MISNHTGQRHFSAFRPIYSLSQEELAALCKFIDENLLQGSSVPLAPPMGLRIFSSGKKMARFDFASTSEASIEAPGKTGTHFHSFPTS